MDNALSTSARTSNRARRLNPAGKKRRASLSERERQEVEGLMRVNHTGEVCAQALYKGQAATSKTDDLKDHLLAAAEEELDHLAWCEEIIQEVGGRTSYLNPVWYAASYGMGAVAGLVGDRWSLGFLVETERQVEAHLDEHLQRLPEGDKRSRAVLEQMKTEEAGHAEDALAAGAATLPTTIRRTMSAVADVMKAVAFRI